jgi:hypothetical protein
MEVFLERLLMELVVIAMQLAFWRLLAWFGNRTGARAQFGALSTAT